MSNYYICKRCGDLKTNHLSNLKKHINRKNPCKKRYDMMFMSDDQLLVMTLIPKNENNLYINENETIKFKKSNKLDKNKKELFNELENIEKNKLKCCKYCNIDFQFIYDLKKHIILDCFFNELEKREIEQKNLNINNINNITNIDNITNTNINNNNNNIININLQLKNPIPFDEHWDITNISEEFKESVIISKVMYTSLLDEILKNETNLNVILDKDKQSGLVYKNNFDKYIQMKSKDIILSTMNKLNEQLNEINKGNKKSFDEIIDFSRKMINKKYIDFQKDSKIQENVSNIISTILENKKDKAINIAEKIIQLNDLENYGY
jgi:hypothetical protein